MSNFKNIPGPAWIGPFLTTLNAVGIVREAAQSVSRSMGTVYDQRRRNPAFAAEWARILAPDAEQRTAEISSPDPAPAGRGSKRKVFLEALAETSNIAASARRAGLPVNEVYKLRRKDSGFAAAWRGALLEGYDMLEMELLGYLRERNPARKMDVVSALRLLAAHRDTVARERALREDDDEEAVLESIDRFIEDMRERRLANEALLMEGKRSEERVELHDAAG